MWNTPLAGRAGTRFASPARATFALAIVAALALGPTTRAFQTEMVAHAAGDAGTLIMVSDSDPADLDPASDQQAGSNNIQRNMYDELFSYTGASLSNYTPELATGYKTNADKSVWTVFLRHGVKFHTGRAMTATDVKYSIARTIDAQLAGSYLFSRFISKPDKQIKIIDKYTVEFDLSSPQPLFLGALPNEYVAAIVDSTEVKKHATKSDPYGHNWLTDHDAGTGPYTLQSWQHGQQVTLQKFPGYWKGWSGRHFSTIIVKTVPDATTRRQLLERGSANGGADLTFDLTPQDDQQLSTEKSLKVVSHFTTEVSYIFMTEAGPLASPLARQAMCYAFNYDAYIKAAYHGYARRAYSIIPSVLFGYDPNVFKYQTDLNKAKALFQQAGVKPGTTFSFYAYDTPYYHIAASILTAQLAQIGMNVKTTILSESAYVPIYYKTEPPSQHPNMLAFSWWPDYNDPWDMAINLIDSKYAGAAGANTGFYHNATVDKLMDQSVNADHPTLLRNFKTIQDIITRQDPPFILLSQPAQVTVMRSDIQGLAYNPVEIQTYSFYSLYR